jgi:MFS family permease
MNRLAQPLRTFREVFGNPELRRLELAWGGFYVGEWAHVVTLFVIAFDAGGVAAVGLVSLLRTLPPAFVVPFSSGLADRYRRDRILLAVHFVRAATIGGAAVVLFVDGPLALVYGLVAAAALASTGFRPAQWALLPMLARTPRELVAANAASSTIESVASLMGPALAGVLLAVTGPGVVFAVSAGFFVWSGVLVTRILPRFEREALQRGGLQLRRGSLAGFRALARDPQPRLLTVLFGAQTFVRGLLAVLAVVASIDLLGMGDSGVGYLNAAVGAGGFIGAFSALSLLGSRRLGRTFGGALVLWGAPIAALGLWPEPAVALAALAVVGVGRSALDTSGLTLLQRLVPDSVLARVFGVRETLSLAAIGIAAVVAPALVESIGIRSALVATGAFLPAIAVLCWRRLERMDAEAAVREREVALLRETPIFEPLPPATIEQLAARLALVRASAGAEIIHQGDPGDRFYLVASGEVEVLIDGEPAGRLGPGSHFGEIALLRNVPRTATVRAIDDVELYALDRDIFVSAVTGHPQSEASADAVVSTRLGSLSAPAVM